MQMVVRCMFTNSKLCDRVRTFASAKKQRVFVRSWGIWHLSLLQIAWMNGEGLVNVIFLPVASAVDGVLCALVRLLGDALTVHR